MNNRTIIVLSIVVLAVVGLITYAFVKMPKLDNWEETLRTKNKDPYDLEMAEKLLFQSYPDYIDRIKISDDLVDDLSIYDFEYTANYFFIGNTYNLTRAECEALISFVQRGNNAFICSSSLPTGTYLDSTEKEMFTRIFSPLDLHSKWNDSLEGIKASLVGYSQEYPFTKYHPSSYINKNARWNVFSEVNEEDHLYIDEFYALGKNDLGNNFIKVKSGDGYFFMHCNPVLFSNYFLKEKKGYDYFKNVMNFMPEMENLIYDDNSRFVKYEDSNLNRKKEFYPLEVIMRNKALKAFVFVLIGLVLFYVFFNSKRKQRTIPLLPDNRNTSIEFSKTIGSLYFQNGNNHKIVEKKMKMFRFFLLNKYGISTTKVTESNIKLIAQKSGMADSFIQSIFEDYKRLINQSMVSAEELMKLHNSIEIFYNNTKV